MINRPDLIGPPEHGPWVTVNGKELHVGIRVNDDDDRNIVLAAIEMSQRRRYGKTGKLRDQITTRGE